HNTKARTMYAMQSRPSSAHFSHFFFSSRRRHTRFSRDWSSDVCSSDLLILTTKREVIAIGNAGFPSERANSRHQRNQEQTIRCRERHGPQQHAVNDSENGRVSADANGKC